MEPLLTVLEEGKAQVIKSPATEYGLDAFYLNQVIQYSIVINKITGKKHYRIKHDHWLLYWEICTLDVFNKYFKILT